MGNENENYEGNKQESHGRKLEQLFREQEKQPHEPVSLFVLLITQSMRVDADSNATFAHKLL
jgi:hypothetical protein